MQGVRAPWAQPARAQEGLQGARTRPAPDVARRRSSVAAVPWSEAVSRSRLRPFVAAGVVATGVGYEGARELSPPSREPDAVVPATTAAVEPRPRSSRRCCERRREAPCGRRDGEAATKAREARGREALPGRSPARPRRCAGTAKKQPAVRSVRATPPGQLKKAAKPNPPRTGQAKKAEPKPKSSGRGRP